MMTKINRLFINFILNNFKFWNQFIQKDNSNVCQNRVINQGPIQIQTLKHVSKLILSKD
ncbi:unnamed protein product [Paramecium primaurelia]|uniref:Uncharacterized protein n=1 Tax=Paramecium primaurelia TaxID=5886 RepID=A0A8S1L0N5_PARPR|nr:unnamed protein product [Paramecium primaurelia]